MYNLFCFSFFIILLNFSVLVHNSILFYVKLFVVSIYIYSLYIYKLYTLYIVYFSFSFSY